MKYRSTPALSCLADCVSTLPHFSPLNRDAHSQPLPQDREDENSLAPGKKGISLTVEQWRKLRQLGAQIDAVLEKCL